MKVVALSVQNFSRLKIERNFFLGQRFFGRDTDIGFIDLQSTNVLVLLCVVDGLNVVDMHVVLSLNIIVDSLLTLPLFTLDQLFDVVRISD